MASYDSDKVAHIHEELHSHLPPEPALRVKALESLLVEKGVLKTDAVDRWLDNFAEKIGPKNGARVIAKSWVDSDFEGILRNDAMQAFTALGLAKGGGYGLKAVFNSDTVHNLIVCTLCSCYPLALIGMSPSWYKSNEYRPGRPRASGRFGGVRRKVGWGRGGQSLGLHLGTTIYRRTAAARRDRRLV